VVIAAAGGGTRFGRRHGVKKQFLELCGRPILWYSLDVFAALGDVARVVVVAAPDDVARVESLVDAWHGSPSAGTARTLPQVVAGGERRQDSVRRGLERFWSELEWALVHDAARPLVRVEDVRRVMAAIEAHGAAAIGYPSTDSVRWEEEGEARQSLDRRRVWQVQTPQGARCELFRCAYDACTAAGEHTDEVSLLAAAGVRVRLVEGSRENVKVTLPGDELLAEFYLARRQGGG
jgi:2-C-methyl-D-erythritol 4-phosphate cytidylyltransferase